MNTKRNVIWLSTPIHVTWYITTKCNLRCSHCYLTDYTQNTNASAVNNVLKKLSTMRVSGISYLGGEPLVRDDLEDIIKETASLGMIPQITTNGMLATQERAQSLFNAGCKEFQVSLEGHSPELSDPVRGKDSFEKILLGVANLKNTGAFVTLNITISKQNYQYVKHIIALAEDVGVDILRLSAFIPFGTGDIDASKFLLTRDIVIQVRETLAEALKTTKVALESGVFLSNDEKVCGDTFGCGAGTHNLIINTDLSLSACDILAEKQRTAPIKTVDDIEVMWKSNPLFNKWRGNTDDPFFAEVHQHHCHLAYTKYGEDLFV